MRTRMSLSASVILDMEEKLRAIDLKYEEKVTELERKIVTLERNNTVLQTTVKEHERKLDKLEKELMAQLPEVKHQESKQKDKKFSNDLQQLREVQKNNEDHLPTLKGSSDPCLDNELGGKMEKQSKEVDTDLSCEVPVTLGKIKYLKMLKSDGKVFKSDGDVVVTECLDGPNPMIKIHSVSSHQRLKAQSEVTDMLSSIETEMFWFPPEKEEVFKYLFGEKENWRNIIESLDVRSTMQDMMTFLIPSLKPFTVEVCGRNRGYLRKVIDELKRFRDNSPMEVGVGNIRPMGLYREVEAYATSKSVSLKKPATSAFSSRMGYAHPRIDSGYSNVTLQGGRYDVQLVLDFIFTA